MVEEFQLIMFKKPLSVTAEFETVKSRLTIDVNLSSPTDFTFHDCPLKLEAKNWGFRSCFYSLPKKEQSKLPIHFFIACEQPAPSPQNKLKIFFLRGGGGCTRLFLRLPVY